MFWRLQVEKPTFKSEWVQRLWLAFILELIQLQHNIYWYLPPKKSHLHLIFMEHGIIAHNPSWLSQWKLSNCTLLDDPVFNNMFLLIFEGTWGFAVLQCWCFFNAVMRWITSQLAVLRWSQIQHAGVWCLCFSCFGVVEITGKLFFGAGISCFINLSQT